MSYLGRKQLGEHILLQCTTVTGAGVPTAPDDAPRITILKPDGTTLLENKRIPAVNKNRYTGEFHYNLFVGANPHVPTDEEFETGKYHVVFEWEISSTAGASVSTFDVVAGGNASGQVVSMYWYERPSGGYMVMQLDSGTIIAGRNPK